MSDAVIKALAVTAELTGTDFSPAAAAVLARDLSVYPDEQVLAALDRCRRELRRGQLTVEAIVTRLPDGRPGAEEAWAMLPHDEQGTTVWTQEMREAWAQVRPMLANGERIPARMAFKEIYEAAVKRARHEGEAPWWEVSLGFDIEGRRVAVFEAVKRRRVTVEEARRLLPDMNLSTGRLLPTVPLIELAPPSAKPALENMLATIRERKAAKKAEANRRRAGRGEATFNNPEFWKLHGYKG